MEKTRNISELIKETLRFGDEKEIPKLIYSILKDPSKMPIIVLDEKTEYGSLDQEVDNLSKKFGSQIEVIKASESQETKSRQALPGKPAILLR